MVSLSRRNVTASKGDALAVLDDVAQFAAAVLAERQVQGDRVLGVAVELDDLGDGQLHPLRHLPHRGFDAQFLKHLPAEPGHSVDDLHRVDRNADRAALVGQGPCQCLPDPPGGVGRELETLDVVELFNGPNQTCVALLDQVQKSETPSRITLGDGDDQAEVGLDEVGFRPVAVLDEDFQLVPERRIEIGFSGEPVLGEQAGLDPLGEVDLLCGA